VKVADIEIDGSVTYFVGCCLVISLPFAVAGGLKICSLHLSPATFLQWLMIKKMLNVK